MSLIQDYPLVVSGAAVIILGLSGYAAYLWWQVTQQVSEQSNEQLDTLRKRNTRLKHDIFTIAWAIREEQCDLSEGCIRISILIDHIYEQNGQPTSDVDSRDNFLEKLPGIAALYDKIKDLPTHEKRNKLDKREKRKQDFQRWKDEAEHKEQILKDVKWIQTEFQTSAEAFAEDPAAYDIDIQMAKAKQPTPEVTQADSTSNSLGVGTFNPSKHTKH